MSLGMKDIRKELTFRKTTASNKDNTTNNPPLERKGGDISSIDKTFKLDDYFWADEFTDSYDDIKHLKDFVPKMILTEFQPIRSFEFEDSGKTATISALAGLADKIVGGGKVTSAMARGYIKSVLELKPSKVIEKYANGRTVLGKESMGFIKNLMQGDFLKMYELPFFSDVYMKADTSGDWSGGNASRAYGAAGMKIMQEQFQMNFPMAPIWNKTTESTLDFSYDFYLINYFPEGSGNTGLSTESLYKNFTFLNALIAGNFWVQLGMIQQSPNLYDVVVPGRFHKYFAAMGITVDYVGKCRRNEYVVEKINSNQKPIKLDKNMLFPDAYKLTLSIKDLTPNNFNVFLEPLMEGDKVSIGTGNMITHAMLKESMSFANKLNENGETTDEEEKRITREKKEKIAQDKANKIKNENNSAGAEYLKSTLKNKSKEFANIYQNATTHTKSFDTTGMKTISKQELQKSDYAKRCSVVDKLMANQQTDKNGVISKIEQKKSWYDPTGWF